jgi:hypothetical protein
LCFYYKKGLFVERRSFFLLYGYFLVIFRFMRHTLIFIFLWYFVLIMKRLLVCLLIFCFFCGVGFGSEDTALSPWSISELIKDLEVVQEIEKHHNNRFPVMYNYYLNGGYFVMPSSRAGADGSMGFSFSSLPPYHNYNIRFQPFDKLEVSGNYRIFLGVEDNNLSKHGFGDYADKGANAKYILFHPEESDYRLPGVAVGAEDFMGTQLFGAQYIVATYVRPEYNFEVSVGYGNKRFNGLFGGMTWMPWWKERASWLQKLAFVAEYDAVKYQDTYYEPSPYGREQKSHLNVGIKYRYGSLDLMVSSIRGKEIAGSIALNHNIGTMRGMLPHFEDPDIYKAPINIEPLGVVRTRHALGHDFSYACDEQGLTLLDLRYDSEEQHLWMIIRNDTHRYEVDFKERIMAVVRVLAPSEMKTVSVVVKGRGLPCFQYDFRNEDLMRSREQRVGDFEMHVISPRKDVDFRWKDRSELLFCRREPFFEFGVRPRLKTFFGSARGKFKYSLGAAATVSGFLWDDIAYSLECSYTFFSNAEVVSSTDMINPSQIINVLSDSSLYQRKNVLSIDKMYLQKSWNAGKGWFFRGAAGHFEAAYGGVAAEALYFPADGLCAFGVETAVLKKRQYRGIKFSETVRKLDGFTPSYIKYTGYQSFFNIYCPLPSNMDLTVKAGRFLAHDIGARFEVSRTFASGLTIAAWFTYTNAHDILNRERYHDKGISLTLPIDIFLPYSSRSEWGHGMAAWSRDIGGVAATGDTLYSAVSVERRRKAFKK